MENVKLEKIKTSWESESKTEISEDIWTEALERVNNSTSCVWVDLIQCKVVHCLHWGREKMLSFYPNKDSNFVQCHVDIVDLPHSFWSCPKLAGYWSAILGVLSEILGAIFYQMCKLVPNEETSMTKKQLNVSVSLHLAWRHPTQCSTITEMCVQACGWEVSCVFKGNISCHGG